MTELIKKILCNGKSLVAAVISLVILAVFRIFVLLNGVDYTDGLNGLYSISGNIYNIIYYIMLVAVLAVISAAVVMDIKNPEKTYDTDIGTKGLITIGAVMIGIGALQSVQVINEFTTGINIFSVFLILGCIAHIVGGVLIASAKKLCPAHSVVAIAVIISQLGAMIEFYMTNFLISKNPQKLMMMLFLLSSTFFWIYFGKILTGNKKFLPKLFCVAGGLFSTVLSLAFLISSFVLLGIDPEKWIRLSYIPGLSLIPAMLLPGVTAAVILLSGMKDKETATEKISEEETAE